MFHISQKQKIKPIRLVRSPFHYLKKPNKEDVTQLNNLENISKEKEDISQLSIVENISKEKEDVTQLSIVENISKEKEDICPTYNLKNNYKSELDQKINILNSKKTLIIKEVNADNRINKHTNILKNVLNCQYATLDNIQNVNLDEFEVIIFQNCMINNLQQSNKQIIYISHKFVNEYSDDLKKLLLNCQNEISNYIFINQYLKVDYNLNLHKILDEKTFIIEYFPKCEKDSNKIDCNLLMSSGKIIPENRFEYLIDFFNDISNNYNLVIIGEIQDDKYYNKLLDQIIDKNKIKIITTTENFYDYLSSCQYYISLCKNLDSSFDLIEAINYNKKILCSKECLNSSNQLYWYPNKLVIEDLELLKEPFYKYKLSEIHPVNYLNYSYSLNSSYINLINNYPKYKIGKEILSNLDELQEDLNNKLNIYKNGFSLLIRVKNEEETIYKNLMDVIDLVDEIIVVDNNSTDNTLKILKELEKLYSNIFVYQYKINVPRCGLEHIENYKKEGISKLNTLCNYYNWTASKATYNKKIKWDGDFYCIRENFYQFLNYFKNFNTNSFAVWFSGLTVFQDLKNTFHIKNLSYYDEYRLFLNNKDDIWSDALSYDKKINVCETSENFVSKINNDYKFYWSFPIFLEIKMCSKDEFTGRSSLLQDGRDSVDFNILKNLSENITDKSLLSTNNLYYAVNFYYLFEEIKNQKIITSPFKVDNKHILKYRKNIINNTSNLNLYLTILKQTVGGVETINNFLFNYILSLGVNINFITLVKQENYDKNYIHYVEFKNNLNKYCNENTIIVNNFDIFRKEELEKIKNNKTKIIGMTHSEISSYNQYFVNNHTYYNKIICINNQSLKKYLSNGITNINLLRNNIKYINNLPIKKIFDKKNIKLLFFSRCSTDKNLIMLIYTLKELIKMYDNITLNLYSDEPLEFEKYVIKEFNLENNVIINASISNINYQDIYCKYDLCILPSVSEGISLNILESINCEIPILCTNIKSNQEIINGYLPLINFENLQNIADKNMYVYNYDKFLDSLGYVINQTKCESPYTHNNKDKINIFNNNIELIKKEICTILDNYEFYKLRTIELKNKLKNIYFDIDSYIDNFLNIILN
jgi:hypothetical protein